MIINEHRLFIESTLQESGIELLKKWRYIDDISFIRKFAHLISQFYYFGFNDYNKDNIYAIYSSKFNEFHKYWEANHRQLLDPKIDKQKAKLAAQALIAAKKKYGDSIFKLIKETHGLPPETIAKVRFFTANQDFREPPENQFEKYFEDDTIFSPEIIIKDPEGYLRFMGFTDLSQTDKRIDFAKNAARFLIEKDIEPFAIASYFDNDALKIRSALIESRNTGYGNKKTNMFIRDMVELNVWKNLKNLDKIDVASDTNVMKLALRIGILQTAIPILSSFLDIFCYQYEYIDEYSTKAWRTVWEQWMEISISTAPKSPCNIDYLLYRIGREYCKNTFFEYECDKAHRFYHFNRRIGICRICRKNGDNVKATPIRSLLPCQIDNALLPRENNILLLPSNNLLSIFEGKCIFEDVCFPKSKDFELLDPPKSISIKGRTGWTSAYADKKRGGGGLMA